MPSGMKGRAAIEALSLIFQSLPQIAAVCRKFWQCRDNTYRRSKHHQESKGYSRPSGGKTMADVLAKLPKIKNLQGSPAPVP
jgi:hypothetical protein